MTCFSEVSRNPARISLATRPRARRHAGYNNYGYLSDFIDCYDAGWVVYPASEAGLIAVLEELCTDRSMVERKSENAVLLFEKELPLKVRHPGWRSSWMNASPGTRR